MPRRLEIRTTILEKKPSGRTKEKDANSNDVYVAEAMQLLEEIEQLKSNIQKTDQRILGTYSKSPPKTRKKKLDQISSTKTAYDVVYPSVATGTQRRDTIVSHCLNPVGTASGGDDSTGLTRSGLYSAGRPWISARTHFTPAPQFGSSTGPSHGSATFWPCGPTSATPSLATVNERIRSTFPQENSSRQPEANLPLATSNTSHSTTGGEQVRSTSGFKRIYATKRIRAALDPSVGEIAPVGSATSHDRVQDETMTQQATAILPSCIEQGSGGQDTADDNHDDDDDNKRASPGENSGHASIPLNMTESFHQFDPQWVDGAEVDESFQPQPETSAKRMGEDSLLEPEIVAARLDEDIDELLPGEGEVVAHPVNSRKVERTRHYNRNEIRQYMQKQKKERKEKLASQQQGYVCHHNRSSPLKRSDLGLPDKLPIVTKQKTIAKNKKEQDWGPYDQPNFVDVLQPSATEKVQQRDKPRKEKSIQTEPPVVQRVDEATQMSSRTDSDESVRWLHSIPPSANRNEQRPPVSETYPSRKEKPESSSRSHRLHDDDQVSKEPNPAEPPPKRVTNLLQKIEDLEVYIGNLLDARTFQPMNTEPNHPSLPLTIERQRETHLDHSPYQQPIPVELPVKETPMPFRSLILPPPVASSKSKTVQDGPSLAEPPPPTPPPRLSSSSVQRQYQLDTTVSTEYHPLPDHLTKYLQIDKRSPVGSSTTYRPPTSNVPIQSSVQANSRSKYLIGETELSPLFQLSRPEEVAGKAENRSTRPPPKTPQVCQEEPQQTYFRDFNEILQMDPNPITEKSNSWKRVPSRQTRSNKADRYPLPPPAPYTILSALSDELKATMNRIPQKADHSSDSDFQSRLSVSDISVPDAVDAPDATNDSARSAHSIASSSRHEIQPSKNGLGSRTGHEVGSRTSSRPVWERSAPHVNPTNPNSTRYESEMPPMELDTTYLTLTPQYTSFEATPSLAVPLDSTSISDDPILRKENNDRSMFSVKLSPIPRAVSPLSLVSDSEPSAVNADRKQSTSSSDRSEHDRSVGEKIIDEIPNRPKISSPHRSAHPTGRKSDELLARLRAEIQRDESLYRSLQHVDKLEGSVSKEATKRFRIQIDDRTKSFLEAQTDVLRAIAQDVRGGFGANTAAVLQGSQAAMEVDRIGIGRQSLDSVRQGYSADFEDPTVRASPEVPTDIPAPSAATPNSTHPQSPHFGSESGELDSSAFSDSSVLPPKAVDILLQEEAKQQRLLLKLREKAKVEKTLAELELLQMQKRLLRSQGERDKVQSIKKKQRGLLLKLQEERARIEALRRQHKKEEQRSKGSERHYDTSSWETDWSAASNSTAGNGDHSASVREMSAPDQFDESSTSTLQPVSEAIQRTESVSNNETDDAEASQARSELEGQESAGSALSNLRLRAPLSPRTTADSIRLRTKFRRRHSSGSDDSINLSQNETGSDVSDVESRLLALTDQLQRRQAEAQRLKSEHKRQSKEKLKAQECALMKQIEVYDRCITDLRSQLECDVDGELGSAASVVVAVRPVIRQPRALIRADEAKSPTSVRSECEAKIESESLKSLDSEGQTPSNDHHKSEIDSGTSSIATQIRSESEVPVSQPSDHDVIHDVGSQEARDSMAPAAESTESDKSLSELSNDPSLAQDNPAEISDSGRTDIFNQTMIIKSDSQVKEELAEDISKSILDQLVEETIDLATQFVLRKQKHLLINNKSSAGVLQRVTALLSIGADVPKKDRSQLYLTTTFDLLSPDDLHSPVTRRSEEDMAASAGGFSSLCDVSSTEGRDALESKLHELHELRIENEWIDDELQVTPVLPDSIPDENRDKVVQEAEALEREQKRIEQEIQKLSAGSALYLQREIPNKPPPPYTPPGQALNWQKIRSPTVTEVKQVVPRSKENIERYCRRFTEYFINHWAEPNVQIPDELFVVDNQLTDQISAVNCRAFLTLLSDLSHQYLSDIGQRAVFLPGNKLDPGNRKLIQTPADLVDAVEEAVMIQLNFRPRLLRESQIARWSQKKRDRVDEILVRELQTEEKLWTNFSTEELQVKRQTADAILDFLLDETSFICKRISQSVSK